jgi:hypothetical protein
VFEQTNRTYSAQTAASTAILMSQSRLTSMARTLRGDGRGAISAHQTGEKSRRPRSSDRHARSCMPLTAWSVVPKIGCAPVFGTNLCDAPGTVFVRAGLLAIVVRGVHPPRNQSAVSAAIALISRSAPGTARPVTRAAVTSGGAPARASRGAIAP